MIRHTVTGNPRTMGGYYLGQLLCRLGRHKRFAARDEYWEDVLLENICMRPGCDK